MKRKIFKIIKFSIILLTLVTSISFLTIAIVTSKMSYQIPEIMNVELYDDNEQKYLSYSNGKKQSYVKINNISSHLINAFISIEDKRFYDHHGIDIIRIGGALLKNIKTNQISEGASTITQQYVKNIYLTSEKTWNRKINEILIAINLEKTYSKDQILEGYLNSIYFDHGIYGVEDASIFYFGKHANELDITEAACIASIPKGPSIYSPIKNPENNKERRNLILSELLNDGIIDNDIYTSSINKELKFIGNNPNDDVENAPYFQDLVLKELESIPEIRDKKANGIKVYTTLNTKFYSAINESIEKRTPNNNIEVAVYAIDPKTGYVKAVIGGKDYTSSTYNRATSSIRQPGSTIKPFLYLTALENGFTVANTFLSEPTTFYYENNEYSPGNFQHIYANQDISMVYALATSDNIYAVKTHLFLGCDKLVNTLKRFNFSGNIPSIPSLALGTKEVSVEELTKGYAILANKGTYVKPTLITKITTMNDEVIYTAKTSSLKIADSTDCYLLSEAMTSIFDNNLTYNIRPTGVSIKSLLVNSKFAAKSGSTDTDNWLVGYNPDIVISVWTGYDNNTLITNTEDSKFGKYIWADSINAYYKSTNINPSWYETPSDVISMELNPMSGFYASFGEYTKPLYFKKSNLPWFINIIDYYKKES